MWRSLRAFSTSTPVLLVLCAATVLSALVGRVMARTTVVRLGYTLSTLQQQNQTLAQEPNALRTELAARRAGFLLDAPKAEQIVTVTTAPRAPR